MDEAAVDDGRELYVTRKIHRRGVSRRDPAP
jgi:hypothetical protein